MQNTNLPTSLITACPTAVVSCTGGTGFVPNSATASAQSHNWPTVATPSVATLQPLATADAQPACPNVRPFDDKWDDDTCKPDEEPRQEHSEEWGKPTSTKIVEGVGAAISLAFFGHSLNKVRQERKLRSQGGVRDGKGKEGSIGSSGSSFDSVGDDAFSRPGPTETITFPEGGNHLSAQGADS